MLIFLWYDFIVGLVGVFWLEGVWYIVFVGIGYVLLLCDVCVCDVVLVEFVCIEVIFVSLFG